MAQVFEEKFKKVAAKGDFNRFTEALTRRGYEFVLRTPDGNWIYRRGNQWAIFDAPNSVLRIGSTELSVDGAEGPLFDRLLPR